MSEKDKQNFVTFALIYFCVFGIMSVTGGLIKFAGAFYHQVILKDK